MTRIVAGFAGSVRLAVPASGTRPTSDRVREAIFSALSARDAIRGARVLDLYAGSGALGLEAASRGASAVTLVERSHAAAAICRRNAAAVTKAASTSSDAQLTVVAAAVHGYLTTAAKAGLEEFDLIFLDPPYELSEQELVAELQSLTGVAAENAVVVIERSARSPEPGWPEGLAPLRRKDYGDTTVWTAIREHAAA